MTIQIVRDPNTPMGEVLEAARATGVVLQTQEQDQFAVLPLDDELLDYLLERSPSFHEDCRLIRQQMRDGKKRSHADVRSLFSDERHV
jgi:hypothetical protein